MKKKRFRPAGPEEKCVKWDVGAQLPVSVPVRDFWFGLAFSSSIPCRRDDFFHPRGLFFRGKPHGCDMT